MRRDVFPKQHSEEESFGRDLFEAVLISAEEDASLGTAGEMNCVHAEGV